MRRIQRWVAGLEVLLGLAVAMLAALVVSAAAALRLAAATPPATTPIPPRAAATATVPDVDAVLATLGPAAGRGDHREATPPLAVWGIASHGGERRAVIENGDGEQGLYRAGDVVDGCTVVEVARDGVTIEADGRRLRLPLETRPAEATPADVAPAPAAPPAPRDVRQVSDDGFLVDRALLLGQVGSMSSLLTQLRAVPEVENGQPIGFRVFAIDDDSIFRRLGLREGDVVRRVNGSTLHDPTALLSFLQGMGDESRIALDLVRAGAPTTLVYDLR